MKKKLEDAVELKDNYQKDYKAYGDCVRKLEQFKLIVSEKENDDEVSNSESQRLLLMVKRIQKTKEQLNKCSSKCIKELTDIKNEHNNVYNALLVDFKNIKTGLLNRI